MKHEAIRLVEVFATSQIDVLPVIKSILEGAEIPYSLDGEAMMNLFPSDMLGKLFKSAAEVKFFVPEDRAEEARALLEERPPEE